jgi:predicted TIM-barrel fold metal-dependent hydrolase
MPAGTRVDPGSELIDCDTHPPAPDASQLRPYLSAHWAEYVELTGYTALPPLEMSYPAGAPTTLRPDLERRFADPQIDHLEVLRDEVFDRWGASRAILNCIYPLGSIMNPDLCEAMTRAVNDWIVAEWLDREPRVYASLVVPPHFPVIAAAEIERLGDHPRIIQIILPVRSDALYGNRSFHPLFAAATHRRLVVGLHFGGYAIGVPPTGSGWPTYYIEEHAGMAQIFQSQVRNLIFEGVFDNFPDARVALIESGFAWLPALLWRMDSDWKNLRRETPWVSRPPSEYVYEHVRLTLQPIDAPDDAVDQERLFDQIDAGRLLMFATDFPHWHFDHPQQAVPHGLADAALRAVLAGNARAFYRMES